MNQRGQAAVTDALYFLLVVTFLSVFLFGFANSYGNNIKEQINNQNTTAFATNALKTILYSSTTRDPDQDITAPNAEIDYVLAILKEDYADDKKLKSTQRNVLGKTISGIMSPVEDNLDYVFIITAVEENDKDFVFFFFHTTNFIEEASNFPARGFTYFRANPDKPHVNYFCAVPALEDGTDTGYQGFDGLQAKLRRLLANIGGTSEASSTIRLTQVAADGSLESIEAQVDLIMWEATPLGKTRDREQGLFYSEDPDNAGAEAVGWGCEEAAFT